MNSGSTEQPNFITEAQAKEIAQTTVASEISPRGWTQSSKVTKIYPLYISGIENVSYWECKVETDDQPAGYVLVTANKTDVLVPELSQTGLTLTEQFQMKTKIQDIAINRYDWFHSAAFPSSGTGLAKRASGRALATIGFENDLQKSGLSKTQSEASLPGDFENFESNYRSQAVKNGCMPGYLKDSIDCYYNQMISPGAPTEGLGKTTADWRDQRAELKNWCPTPAGAPWHTVQWKQYDKPNGYAIGCGAIAWAIVYAYWDGSRGKSALFGTSVNANDYSTSGNETNSNIKPVIEFIYDCLGTFDAGNGAGMTWPSSMENGIYYAINYGYPASSVTKRNGTEYGKFDHVKGCLNEHRPCILLIHSDGIGIVNHYVVIEAARKTQTKYAWIWHDRNVYYTVNYGWGSTRKQICVRDWGQNQNDVYTSTSVYEITVN